MRITIGKENCINDTIILIDNSLPQITDNLGKQYAKEDYTSMKKEIDRLKRVTEDLEDMVFELDYLKTQSI